jgi:hypothetical protein
MEVPEMYCSNCASQIKPELNYCNNCGQKNIAKIEQTGDPVAKTLSYALAYIGIFALIGFVFLIKSLLDNDITDGRLIALAFMYLAAIFGIVYLILQKIGPAQNKAEPIEVTDYLAHQTLKSVDTNQLPEPSEVPASVTENTTRTFEMVTVDRK